jgi:hypothetical protein
MNTDNFQHLLDETRLLADKLPLVIDSSEAVKNLIGNSLISFYEPSDSRDLYLARVLINSFINAIPKLVESGELSLPMLAARTQEALLEGHSIMQRMHDSASGGQSNG